MRRFLPDSVSASLIATSFALSAIAGTPPAGATTGDPVLINEVLGSTTGTDVEFVELYGDPDLSLDGLSLILVESDDQSSNGSIDYQYDFGTGDTLGENGFFLIGTESVYDVYEVTPNRSIPTNFIENSSYTIALVETSSISGGSVSGSEIVLDALGVWDGDSSDSFFFDVPVIGPDGTFLPAGGRRVVDGVDTDTAADWVLADFSLGPDNTPTAGTGDAGGGPVDCFERSIDPIGAVQGDDDISPCAGKLVTVNGIVTRVAVDLLEGRGVEKSLDGFFVQDGGDGNAATSDGIFVYLDGLSDADRDDYDKIKVGDEVTVEGVVSEFFGLTEITADSISVGTAGNEQPAPAQIDLVALQGALEPYESMLVETGDLFAANSFDFDHFGEIESYPFLAFQPTELHDPGSDGYLDELAILDAGRIIVDDLRGGTFNEPVPFYVTDDGVDRVIRWGDSIPNGRGILGYGFGEYRFYPLGNPIVPGDTFQPTNPRPTAAPEVGGTLKVASLNTLNFWTNDGGQERGARTQEQFDIQSGKLVKAIVMMNADVLALQELQNDPQGDLNGTGVSSDGRGYADFAIVDEDGSALESAEMLARLVNETLGYERYVFLDTGVIGTDAIKVGFIYDRTRVRPLGNFEIVDDSVDPRYDDDRNRPALVQVFKDLTSKENFTAAAVHFKSKGDSGLADEEGNCNPIEEDPRDCDQGDSAGYWNYTRSQGAEVLLDYLNANAKRGWRRRILVLGDFNAYTREDPVQVFEDAGWLNLDELSGEEPASFVFDGLAGNLDHAFASRQMVGQITDAELYDINGAESYETQYFGPLVEPGTEFRSSDHSPLLIGIDLVRGGRVEPDRPGHGCSRGPRLCRPWPPRHHR